MKLSVHSKHGTYARHEAGTIRWTECDAIERDPTGYTARGDSGAPKFLWRTCSMHSQPGRAPRRSSRPTRA